MRKIFSLAFLFIFLTFTSLIAQEETKIIASDGSIADSFGSDVSIDGDYAVVGAQGYETTGAAYVYKNDGNNWVEIQKLLPDSSGIWFGHSVAISGNYLAVGDCEGSYGVNSGSVYVYKLENETWILETQLFADEDQNNGNENFGNSVSLTGDYLIAGMRYDSEFGYMSGSAYIYKLSETGWVKENKIYADDATMGYNFGESVDINGEYAVVGALYGNGAVDSSGAVYIFEKNGTNWIQAQKIYSSDGDFNDRFGASVSINENNTILTGSYGDDDIAINSGSTYIFNYTGTTWNESAKLKASDANVDDSFGNSVSLRKKYAIIGASHDDENGTNSGAIYLFHLKNQSWSQKNKIIAGDGSANDYFGNWTDLDDENIISSAHFNGNGSAYIYKYDMTPPAQPQDFTAHAGDNQVIFTWTQNTEDDLEYYVIYRSQTDDYSQADSLGNPSKSGTNYTDNTALNNTTYYYWLSAVDTNSNHSDPAESGTVIPTATVYADNETKILANDRDANDYFGQEVSISGDFAIVSSANDDENGSNSGSAYIFKKEGSSWNQYDKLFPDDGQAGDGFGAFVCLDGYYAIISAYHCDEMANEAGAAYIYKYENNSWSKTDKLFPNDNNDDDQFGISVSISGDYAIVGKHYDDINGTNSGSAYIFKRDGENWNQEFKILPDDGAEDDRFGETVAIDGDYALIGAPRDDDYGLNSGSGYLFRRNGTVWTQIDKINASNAAASDYFGISVSLSDSTILIGAKGADGEISNSGAAYIYKIVQQQAVDETILYADGLVSGDLFGRSTAIDGNYAVIGAPYGDYFNGDDIGISNFHSGSAYLFRFNGTDWVEYQNIPASGITQNDEFGIAAAINGDNLIIGNHKDDNEEENTGSAYIYNFNMTPPAAPQNLVSQSADGQVELNWNSNSEEDLSYYIVYRNTTNDSLTADSLNEIQNPDTSYIDTDVNNETKYYYWISAVDEAFNKSIFSVGNSGLPTEAEYETKILASDGLSGDQFGYSVDISGDYAIVGAYLSDIDFANSGSVYIYKRTGNNWEEEDILTPDDGEADDWFGYSVSISGDYAIIGAMKDDDDGTSSGSAYIFKRNGTDWVQQQKLKANDSAPDCEFGTSVSIDGDYAVIGAERDDENGSQAGAAYIFKRTLETWSQETKLMASNPSGDARFGHSVCIDGNMVIIGANRAATAYIFSNNGSSWDEVKILTAPDGDNFNAFGWSVSISGNYAVVGAESDETNIGAAYIFNKIDAATWNDGIKITANDGEANDYFGRSVAINGEYVIVGSFYDDNDGGSDAGSAYLFKRSETDWTQEKKIIASDGADQDWFGEAVALSADYVLIGSPKDDDNDTDSGSAYFYSLNAAIRPVVNAKIFLQGPYTDSEMNTALFDGGYIPLAQPFNTEPWNYNGSENVAAIPAGVVDWVLVELRTGPEAASKISTRAAFVKSDGVIVDTDGNSPVSFSSLESGDYYIVLSHRNHLQVMSSTALTLNASSSLYDFSTSSDKFYGADGAVELSSGIWGMIGGDSNQDGNVTVSDNNIIMNNRNDEGYESGDINLDGNVTVSDNNLCMGNRNKSTQVPQE